jgi:hypothetical protein
LKKVFLAVFILLVCSGILAADEGTKNVTYTYGTSSIFVGIMAALWAVRTGRSGWLWFFFGWFLAPFACLFGWLKNREDLMKKRKSA